jgi:hypothetical protein
MSGALPHRGALDMGRGHDAIACDAGGGDLRPAWSRQKQVSRNDELRYHNDFQRRRVIAQERSVDRRHDVRSPHSSGKSSSDHDVAALAAAAEADQARLDEPAGLYAGVDRGRDH